MAGIVPTLGRAFIAAEYFDDAPAVAILSDGLWRRRFGADPAVVGRVIHVDDQPRIVIGVMPRGAALPGSLAGSAERPSHKDLGARLVPIEEQTVRSIRPALLIAAASVALLLLVATANASTLLIARASNRRHELAVRAARTTA